MKRSEVLLRNMSNIVWTCIVLHNLCIVNNEMIEEEWIVKAQKIAKIVSERKIRDGSELRGERVEIAEVKRNI